MQEREEVTLFEVLSRSSLGFVVSGQVACNLADEALVRVLGAAIRRRGGTRRLIDSIQLLFAIGGSLRPVGTRAPWLARTRARHGPDGL